MTLNIARTYRRALMLLVALLAVAPFAHAQTSRHVTTHTKAKGQQPADRPASQPQSDLAAKDKKFETIPATAPDVKRAIVATNLAVAKKQIGKDGFFVGTVAKVFAPRGNNLVILNFAVNYRTAVSAIVKSANFNKFPDLKTLSGKKVLISGKVIDYKGQPEVELEDPAQIHVIGG